MALLAMAISGAVVWEMLGRQRTSAHWVEHTDAVLLHLGAVRSDIIDAETAERGFVITSAEPSLAPLGEGEARLETDLAELAALVEDNPQEQARVAALADHAHQELAALARVVALRRRDPAAATHEIAIGADRRLTDDIRARVGELRSAELALLADREDAEARSHRLTSMVVLIVLASLFAGLAYALVRATRLEERRVRDDFREHFLGIVGHDLRAPLTAIGLEAQMLRSDAGARILASGRRMERMIDQLLDVTRTRLGNGIPIELATVEARAILRAAVGGDPRVAIAAPAEIEARLDPDRFAQIATNLVGNALEHGDGRAAVSLVRRGDALVLSVHNAGEPIPGETRRHLFDAFHPTRGESRGLGLGLYIVDQLVRGHGGTIAVHSTPAEGTTFEVSLPACRSA